MTLTIWPKTKKKALLLTLLHLQQVTKMTPELFLPQNSPVSITPRLFTQWSNVTIDRYSVQQHDCEWNRLKRFNKQGIDHESNIWHGRHKIFCLVVPKDVTAGLSVTCRYGNAQTDWRSMVGVVAVSVARSGILCCEYRPAQWCARWNVPLLSSQMNGLELTAV